MSTLTVKKLPPQDWSTLPLGSLFFEEPKSRVKVEQAATEGRYPFFTSGEAILRTDYPLVHGAHLFLATGGTANIKYYEEPASYSSDTYCISARNINAKLLYYNLVRDLNFINYHFFEGSGLKHLQKGSFKQHTISFPNDTSEQQKLAEVLTTVDETVEETDAIIEKYKRIKQGLMQDLFRYGIDENGQIRSEKTHRFKDSLLGRIAGEWEIFSIAQLEEMLTSGSRGWAKYYSADGALFLRIGNLTREHINLRFDDLVFVTPPKGGEGLRTKTKPDDILISITADLGIIGIVPDFLDEAYVNQHIALLRIDFTKADPHWIALFLASHAGQKQFQDKNESGAKAGLSLPTVRSILVPVPKPDEQRRIVTKIDSCDKAIVEEVNYKQKLLALKRGLMEDLLSGAVRVNHLIEE